MQIIKDTTGKILTETSRIIVDKEAELRLIISAVLAEGHVLLDDLPGTGKTTLVKALSLALGCDSGRIQFVPDLLPSDILGMSIYNQKSGEFQLRQGPVMTNLLLADEINRAIPRTQSALLEAMEERQVTIEGESMPLPRPFVVLATQNPVESESTFRLPAAQMDRFMVRISLGYLSAAAEADMLRRVGDSIPFHLVEKVTDAKTICDFQEKIQQVHVADTVVDYLVALTGATRNHYQLRMGAGPRGSRALYKMCKAWAAMDGRDFVTPDDVQALFLPVISHRLLLTSEAQFSGITTGQVLQSILESTPVPPVGEGLVNG